ncbi:AfsR/SARP family transcriptional regulator [Actinosynnema sp. NPDC020468]|uniref:AfsR/SARP family transcriptional regulator n=1 Tax=Actinosynnema sp. NPDC020468 TaxID=3154488 RepID=UPI003406B04F
MTEPVEYRILGPLEVQQSGTFVELGSPRQRILLTMLLLEAGRPVPFDRLIDAIWNDSPPASARTQVRICVSALRRRLASLDGDPDPIETHHAGYLLRAPAEATDFGRFRRLVRQAGEAVADGRPEDAVRLRRTALGLWRGPVGAGLDSELVRTLSTKLAEEQLLVLEERFDLELALGLHRDVVGELAAAVAENPFRERLCAQLMLAFYRSGRQADALRVFQATRHLFDRELGIEPGAELRALQQAVLCGDDGPRRPARPEPQLVGVGAGYRLDLDRLRRVEHENARLRSDLAAFRQVVTSWRETDG